MVEASGSNPDLSISSVFASLRIAGQNCFEQMPKRTKGLLVPGLIKKHILPENSGEEEG
jgi:hypothetical protein